MIQRNKQPAEKEGIHKSVCNSSAMTIMAGSVASKLGSTLSATPCLPDEEEKKSDRRTKGRPLKGSQEGDEFLEAAIAHHKRAIGRKFRDSLLSNEDPINLVA